VRAAQGGRTDQAPLAGHGRATGLIDAGGGDAAEARGGVTEQPGVALHQRAAGLAGPDALVDAHEARQRIAHQPRAAGKARTAGLSQAAGALAEAERADVAAAGGTLRLESVA